VTIAKHRLATVRAVRTTLTYTAPAFAAATAPTAVPTTDGRSLVVRGALESDLTDLMAMHARCSRRTLLGRYLTGTRPPPRRLARRLLETDIALVVCSPTGSVVGLGNLAAADEDPHVAELAVVVEDSWQGRGVGTAVVRQLVAGARLAGFDEVVTIAPTIGGWTQQALARLGTPLLQRTPFGEAVVRLTLAPHHVGLLGRPVTQVPRVAVSRPGVA
jgi:N-acetylglutamate synthase-like GNAT family acetyltransferase